MELKQIEKVFDQVTGVKLLGIQNNPCGQDVILFNDLYTNSTLAIYENDLSVEGIKNRIKEFRNQFITE